MTKAQMIAKIKEITNADASDLTLLAQQISLSTLKAEHRKWLNEAIDIRTETLAQLERVGMMIEHGEQNGEVE